MAALATWAEMSARPGFAGVEQSQAEAVAEDASGMVRDLVKPLLDEVDPPEVPASIRAVVIAMVRRGVDNPNGYASESLGDYSRSTAPGGVATVYMTKREEKIVRRAVGLTGPGALEMTGDLPVQLSEVLDP